MSVPLFVTLAGRRVLVVGGGPVSARRVDTFLADGALVHVIAPWLCETLTDRYTQNQLTWAKRDYHGPADLEGAWLVHTATGDRQTDTRVSRDCAATGRWCIDATDARVSPVALGAAASVHTPDGTVTIAAHSGGDPGTSMAVRDAAADIVRTALALGQLPLQRTRARAHTPHGALSPAGHNGDGAGWVALVGGGPGHDDFLTARAHELLASADVVVIDRLAPQSVVNRLPATVRVIDVGKAPGHHPVPQHDINQILIDEALTGHAVVRFKGGDPYVFGRGGEERLACEEQGIRVEVVAGVSSAVAVPAAAGIPVTHRGLARAFTVVTGHDDLPGLPPGADHTLVLLMGVARLSESAQTLIASGRGPDCPVAIIERGYLPTQRVTLGTLATIGRRAAQIGVRSPAVIVVGDVVTLAHDNLPQARTA